MDTSAEDNSVVTEELWHAWVRKGKLREQAGARRRKRLAGITLVILALGTGSYFLMFRWFAAS